MHEYVICVSSIWVFPDINSFLELFLVVLFQVQLSFPWHKSLLVFFPRAVSGCFVSSAVASEIEVVTDEWFHLFRLMWNDHACKWTWTSKSILPIPLNTPSFQNTLCSLVLCVARPYLWCWVLPWDCDSCTYSSLCVDMAITSWCITKCATPRKYSGFLCELVASFEGFTIEGSLGYL
jgi:uncharacterized protein Usg